MEHLYWDLGSCAGGALFEIELRGSAARVCFMTITNYQDYLDGEAYAFHGGFYDHSPVVLGVPHDDHWYLVVDSNHHRVTARVEQVFD